MSCHFTRLVPMMMISALVLLAGCANGPSPMPKGYAHHNTLYKAPPGAEAKMPRHLKKAQKEQRAKTHAALSQPVMDDFDMMGGAYVDSAPATHFAASPAPVIATQDYRIAADDLVARTEKNFGRLSEPVLVRAPSGHDAGEGAFAAALEQVLSARNYRVATASGDSAYTLGYQIDRNQFDSPERAMATLNVHVMESIAWQESGIYTLPLGITAPAAATQSPAMSETRPTRLMTAPVEAQYVLPKTNTMPEKNFDEPRMAGGDMRGPSGTESPVEIFPID